MCAIVSPKPFWDTYVAVIVDDQRKPITDDIVHNNVEEGVYLDTNTVLFGKYEKTGDDDS